MSRIEQLPENARRYIQRIEEAVGAPIDIISTGPDRQETMILKNPFIYGQAGQEAAAH